MRTKGIKGFIERTYFLPAICLLVSAVIVSTGAGLFNKDGFQAAQDVQTAQNKKRNVENGEYQHTPLHIQKMKIRGKEVDLGKDFDEEDDWLKTLSFQLMNISSKPIIYISAYIEFTETRDTRSTLAHRIVFGSRPDPSLSTSNDKSLLLIPGDVTTYSMSEKSFANIEGLLGTRGYTVAKIHRFRIRIDEVYFLDQTRWAIGHDYEPDPSTPGGYRKVGK